MNASESKMLHVSPKMGCAAVDYDQTQATSLNHFPNEEVMMKPLICSFFKRVPTTISQNFINGRSGTNGRAGSAAVSPFRIADKNAVSTQAHLPPFPVLMEDPVLLFPLTPSVKVPLRHSKRSGRILNESETLQEKHAQEYRFIVPMLAYAIECTITEHDAIRQKADIPAYISLSSSLVPSPTRKRRPSGESYEDEKSTAAATVTGAEEDPSHGGGADGAISGDRDTALGYKVFQTTINAFSTREVPAISVHDYLKRIVKYTYVSPSVLVCGCLYLDRLLTMYPSFLLHPNNIFKFLITATRVCSKIMDTRTLNNRDFSVVGGVANEDINALEFMFVQLLQNRLYISRRAFDAYCDPLRRQAAHVDVEGEWDGATLAIALPVNDARQSGYPHQPSRPSLARNSTCGSVTSRSRRSSTMSQNEYSLSMASQSGVSPLRSASRPAFPPSASMGQSISVDADFLAPARQSSAAPSRGESTVTSARRHPMNGSNTNNSSTNGNNNASMTSRSPVLPQVHLPTTAAMANNNNSNGTAASTAVPAIRNVSSATMLRSSGNFEDNLSSTGLAQTANSAFINLIHQQQTLESVDDVNDTRARSIPMTGTRGFSSSWNAASTGRPQTTTTNNATGVVGLSASAISNARCNSPTVMGMGVGINSALTKSRCMDAADGDTTPRNMIGDEPTPTRRVFAPFPRGDGVALPPVPRSGRRGRSGSLAGSTGVAVPNMPPPPEFRQH